MLFEWSPPETTGRSCSEACPAARLGDSTLSAAYPWRGTAADDAAKLDEASLSELGEAILGAIARLAATPGSIEAQPTWFAAWGQIIGKRVIVGIGLSAALIGLVASLGEPLRLLARLAQAALLAVLLWRHPLLTVWLLALPSLTSLARGPVAFLVGLLPTGAIIAAGTLGSSAAGGMRIVGLWLRPWEIVAFAMALVLLFVAASCPPREETPRADSRRSAAASYGPRPIQLEFQGMEQVLEGNLARFEVPDLLTFLNMGRRTGVLVMERPEQETKIFFRDGQPIFSTSTKEDLRAPSLLVRQGKVPEERAELLRMYHPTGVEKMGQVLISENLLSERELGPFLKVQISGGHLRHVPLARRGLHVLRQGSSARDGRHHRDRSPRT